MVKIENLEVSKPGLVPTFGVPPANLNVELVSPVINPSRLYKLYLEPSTTLRQDKLKLIGWKDWLSRFGRVISIDFEEGKDRDMLIVSFDNQASVDAAFRALNNLEMEIDTPFRWRAFK